MGECGPTATQQARHKTGIWSLADGGMRANRNELYAGNDPRRLRAIARKLIEMAESGDLQAIKEVGDRLDGKCAQTIECGDVSVEVLSDRELFATKSEGSHGSFAPPVRPQKLYQAQGLRPHSTRFDLI
jgi:hypothetical protein